MGVAALISDMVRAGVDADLVGRAAELLCEREIVVTPDPAAERRKAADRERKRLRNSADSADSAETETKKEIPPTPPKEKTNKNIKPKTRAREAEAILAELEAVLSPELAADVVHHRKKLKKPLSLRAAKGLSGKFAKCRDGPEAAAEAMIVNGWQGFEPEWIENGKRNSNNGSDPAGKRDALRDLLDEAKEFDRRGGDTAGGHGEEPGRRAIGAG